MYFVTSGVPTMLERIWLFLGIGNVTRPEQLITWPAASNCTDMRPIALAYSHACDTQAQISVATTKYAVGVTQASLGLINC